MSVSLLGQHNFLRHITSDLTERLSDQQRMAATGKRAETHGDLGLQASTVQALRAEVNAVEAFRETTSQTRTRMEAMQASLLSLHEGAVAQRDQLNGALYRNDVALPFLQGSAEGRLDDAIGKLNLQIEGRYLFSGRSTDTRPVVSSDAMLDGQGAASGLVEVMDRRLGGDTAAGVALQASNPSATEVQISDPDAALGLTFLGFENSFGASPSSDTDAAAGVGVDGDAKSEVTLDLASGTPINDGDTVTANLRMPDGGQLELVLVAGNAPGRIDGLPMEGGKQSLRVSFDRGASAADAAASLRDVLNQAITDIRNDPAFEGASLARGAGDFFHEDGPRWVAGGTLQAASEDDVVHWYRGDGEGDPASSQLARIAEGTIVDYGVRANQGELRDAVKQTAMIAAIGPNDPSDLDAYRAFAQRAAAGSGRSADAITTVHSHLGVKQELVERVDGQHAEASNLMSRRVAEIEEADPYEVATKLAELQQQLEATYAITGRTQGLSLVNFMT